MRPLLLTCAALLLLALTAPRAGAEERALYNPKERYSPGQIYSVSLPSSFGKTKPSLFTGTFKAYTNPFTGDTMMIPHKGEYRDARGMRFVGAFDYIPKRYNLSGYLTEQTARQLQAGAGGSFIFAGERFDELADEDEKPLVSGIFVSQYEAPLSSYSFILAEATPEYVEKLAAGYRKDLAADQEHRKAVKAYTASNQGISDFLSFASSAIGMFGGFSNLAGELNKVANLGNLGNLGGLANLGELGKLGDLGKLGELGKLAGDLTTTGDLGNMAGGNGIGSIGTIAANLTRKMEMVDTALQVVKGVVTEDQNLEGVLTAAVGTKIKSLIRGAGGADADRLIKAYDSLAQMK